MIPGMWFHGHCIDQTSLSHSIVFIITCTSVTGGIMMNRRQL